MATLLVVEDEYDIAIAIELVFEAEGYRVIKAYDGQEALDLLSRELPDIILLDQMMPRLTGLEMLKILKNDSRLKRIPVILMSAVVPKVAQADYGWNAYIRKPFDVDFVLELVSKLLAPVSSKKS